MAAQSGATPRESILPASNEALANDDEEEGADGDGMSVPALPKLAHIHLEQCHLETHLE